MPIGATLYSGGRGCEVLLTDRIDFRYAVEYDAQIAAVGAQLGGHTFVSRVEDVDYSLWGALDYLHASPVCKSYSQANTNGIEGESDMSGAAAIVRCMEATQPRVFTLENVGAYQHGQAFRLICAWLNSNGYMWHYEVLNSADFGVAQTRRRLILRAVKDALLPSLPNDEPWVGWYQAIKDLIPTLPESAFAPWQLSRLAAARAKGMDIGPNIFVGGANKSQSFLDSAIENRPSIPGLRNGDEPIMVVPSDPATNYAGRAFLVGEDSKMGMVAHSEPAMTRVSSHRSANMRAWLIESKNANQQYGDGARREDEPATTVVTDHKPSHQPKAWLSAGRVVRMTPRALARFQSLPDSYVLPDRASLACTIIGNAVPSLMMRKIVEQLL